MELASDFFKEKKIMGRPLKIQKLSTGSGSGGASVGVDLGYPNFGSLVAPVFNSPTQTLNDAQYVGVVGGAAPTDTPSATNPRIVVTVNITLATGSAAGSATGYIIRQKGSHKYLVGDATSRTALVVGNAYMIAVVGNTAWTAYGAPATTVLAQSSLPQPHLAALVQVALIWLVYVYSAILVLLPMEI